MLHWFGSFADTILTLGYLGVFVALFIEGLGLPFPGDAAMAFYGFATARGQFHLISVIAMSLCGYLTGSLMAYLISRKYGRRLSHRISRIVLLNSRNMMRTTRLIDKYGALLLIPGRFLPGVRSVSSYVAGWMRMDWRQFVLYTFIGSLLWCSMWVGLGYWFEENIKTIISTIQSSFTYLTVAIVLIVLGGWLYNRKFRTVK